MYKTTYSGYDIFIADNNASGIKYYTRTINGDILKADTLQGLIKLIRNLYKGGGVFGNEYENN